MGKSKYHQIEKSEEKPVRREAESEKEREDFSKWEKKSREKQGHIYQGKRRKLQDDNSNEEMVIQTKGQTSKS